jgi:hypothetical protein
MVEILVRCLVGFAQGNVDDGEVDVNGTEPRARAPFGADVVEPARAALLASPKAAWMVMRLK